MRKAGQPTGALLAENTDSKIELGEFLFSVNGKFTEKGIWGAPKTIPEFSSDSANKFSLKKLNFFLEMSKFFQSYM